MGVVEEILLVPDWRARCHLHQNPAAEELYSLYQSIPHVIKLSNKILRSQIKAKKDVPYISHRLSRSYIVL